MFKRPLSTQKPLLFGDANHFPVFNCHAVYDTRKHRGRGGGECNVSAKCTVGDHYPYSQDKTAVTENTGSYTTSSTNTATKLNLSLRETPQTVKVYTREYLDDRNIESFQDLMITSQVFQLYVPMSVRVHLPVVSELIIT
jgi:outer membrane receptor for ferric coprogen and ferric-rhodotorulic acid